MPKQIRRKRGQGSIYKHGRSWYISFYAQGVRVRERIGSINLITKGIAEQALKVRVAEVIQGKFNIESVKKYLSIEDLINKYLNWIKDNQKTSTREKSVLKIFLNYIRIKRINEITTWDIEQYKSKRKKDGLKPNTINRELTVLRSMFNRAIEWDELKTNPVKGVKKALPLNESEHERKAKYITREDFNIIIENANSELRDFIIVARNTGMRISEICNLRVSDINLQKEEIFIRDSKNYTQRSVPINNTVKNVLIELIKDKDDKHNIFKHHNRNSLGIAFRRLLAALNMKGRYRPHDLRHTFITDLVTKGFDLKTIMEITGHKDIRMLIERYTHPSKENKSLAVKSLDVVNQKDNIIRLNNT